MKILSTFILWCHKEKIRKTTFANHNMNKNKIWKWMKVLRRIFFVPFSCFDRQKLFCSLILCDIIIIISGESRFESGGANPFAIFFPSSKHLVRSSCFVVATFVYLINVRLRMRFFFVLFFPLILWRSDSLWYHHHHKRWEPLWGRRKSICHLFPIIKTFGPFVLCGGYFCLPNKQAC